MRAAEHIVFLMKCVRTTPTLSLSEVVTLLLVLISSSLIQTLNYNPMYAYAAAPNKKSTIGTPFSPLLSDTDNDSSNNTTDTGPSISGEDNSQNQMTTSSSEDATGTILHNNNNTTTSAINSSSNSVNNPSNNNYSNSSYIVYQDPIDGLSMSYPSSWEKIEYPPGATNYGIGHRIVASFLAPVTNSSGLSREYVSLEISNNADVAKIIPQNQNQSGVIKSTTKLAGHNAFKLVYANKENIYLNSMSPANLRTADLKIMQVWTTVGPNTYLFTYQAEASKYSEYLPMIQRMLDSFKLL